MVKELTHFMDLHPPSSGLIAMVEQGAVSAKLVRSAQKLIICHDLEQEQCCYDAKANQLSICLLPDFGQITAFYYYAQ